MAHSSRLRIFLVLACLCAAGCRNKLEAGCRPNVLLVLTDSLRFDRLSVYGYTKNTAPSVAAFAADAVVFENAHSASSWTAPSVASIFTGLRQSQHGIGTGSSGLPVETFVPELVTMAEMFSQAGFATFAQVANPLVRSGFSQGFDRFDETGPTTKTIGRFAARLKAAAAVNPFFAYLHLMQVHTPWGRDAPPEPRCIIHLGSVTFDVSEARSGEHFSRLQRYLQRHPDYDRRKLACLSEAYDSGVKEFDRLFGALLAALKEGGIYDHTIIVLTSDHGDEILDHGTVDHGHTLYEELIHVPLIIRVPGLTRPARVPDIVEHVDLLPTLLDLVGIDHPPGPLAGRSFLALLRGEKLDRPQYALSQGRLGSYAWISGGKKLFSRADGVVPDEVYDLSSDPAERRSVSAEHPELAARLKSEALVFQDSLAKIAVHPPSTSIDLATRARMRALGYVDER